MHDTGSAARNLVFYSELAYLREKGRILSGGNVSATLPVAQQPTGAAQCGKTGEGCWALDPVARDTAVSHSSKSAITIQGRKGSPAWPAMDAARD